MWVLIIIWLIWWGLSWIPPQWAKVKTKLFGAMTIAPFIFYSVEFVPSWMKKHEMRHIWQQRILSPPDMLILYVANYLVNYLWTPFAVIIGLVDNDWKLIPWRYSDPITQLHAASYVYVIFELDAIKNGGWITKPERRVKA